MLSNMKIRSQPRQINLETKIEYNFLKTKIKGDFGYEDIASSSRIKPVLV